MGRRINQRVDQVSIGDISSVTAGDGLSGGGSTGALTIALDVNELSVVTATTSDYIAIEDVGDGSTKKALISDVVSAGDVTGVTAGTNVDVTNPTGPVPTVSLAIDAEVNFADQLATRPEMKDYAETLNAIGSTGGGTQDIDINSGNVASATVDTSTNTFTFSNPSATGKSCSFTLYLTNGGSQTVTWPGTVDWAGGTAPTLTTSGVDVLAFTTLDAGSIWYGFAAGLDMS